MTHPHRELIIKLMDDPTLHVEQFDGEWREPLCWNSADAVARMAMHPEIQFRLREKPKPDVVVQGVAYQSLDGYTFSTRLRTPSNLRLTFTADGVLKNAEVL